MINNMYMQLVLYIKCLHAIKQCLTLPFSSVDKNTVVKLYKLFTVHEYSPNWLSLICRLFPEIFTSCCFKEMLCVSGTPPYAEQSNSSAALSVS